MKMAEAILHRTVELSEKLDKANRQFKASGGSKGGTKAEAAKAQVDSLKRVVSDLEEIVLGNVIPAVFMHRYRDSNMYIRAFSLDSLSAMTMLRPDLFLADKFTKYFGWMLSDKEACVRIASINGIMKPFQAVGTDPKNTAQARMVKQIDLDKMENVVGKFRVRLADCCIDVNTAVQEKAMACLLLLERNSFMDDLEDERVWDQINRRAISLDTTPSVRRDALYFVLEQLEAFDDDDFEEMAKQTDGLLSLTNTTTTDTPKGKKRTKTTTKGASLVQSVEKMTIQRLDALAAWLAHTLTDGPIKLEDIRIDLADCLVESLRSMPEHKILVTRWPAMLKTIGDDTRSGASGNRKKGTQNRVDVARQRVLVQMLASAVQAEVGDVASDDFLSDTDGAFVNPQTSGGASSGPSKRTKRRKTGVAAGLQHEVLSAALLKALPDLLLRFKTDPAILSSVAILARYLLPSVISLPEKKKEFKALLKQLVDAYTESSDETVLRNVAESLAFLARDGHTRSQEARIQIQKLVSSLGNSLTKLLQTNDKAGAVGKPTQKDKDEDGKSNDALSLTPESNVRRSRRSRGSRSSRDSEDTTVDDDDKNGSTNKQRDTEFAISLDTKRLRILAKRMDLAKVLSFQDPEKGDKDSTGGPVALDVIRNTIVSGVDKRLKARQVEVVEKETDDDNDNDDEEIIRIPDIWETVDSPVHAAVAVTVGESLQFLLATTAWALADALDNDPIYQAGIKGDPDQNEDTDLEEHVLVKEREQIEAVIHLCFEQNLSGSGDVSDAHIDFAESVQRSATLAMADLRTLFPKGWSEASSPLLRLLALDDDRLLVSQFVQYFKSKEAALRSGTMKTEQTLDLLLPFASTVATNWSMCNRREAGYALAHIVGSGPESSQIIGTLTRIVKKIDPVRLLETHMASLRTAFDDWLNNEPAEVASQRPTDEEMAAFAEAEKSYQERLQLMEQQAARLSQSLGVGKLPPTLRTPLVGFLKEGMRHAFSNETSEMEEPLMLGGRLTFLTLLSKYATWASRDKEIRAILQRDLDSREDQLRNDPDFDEVHEDDLETLAMFRKALGIRVVRKSRKRSDQSTNRSYSDGSDMDTEGGDDRSATSGNSSSIGSGSNRSGKSSVVSGSVRTGSSGSGTGDGSGWKRKPRGSSVGSGVSRMSTTIASLSPLMEEEDGDESPTLSPSSRTPTKHQASKILKTHLEEDEDDKDDAPTGRRSKVGNDEEDEGIDMETLLSPSPAKRRKKSYSTKRTPLSSRGIKSKVRSYDSDDGDGPSSFSGDFSKTLSENDDHDDDDETRLSEGSE